MNREAFEKLVQQALRSLPGQFKRKLENISVEVEDEPSPDLLQEMGLTSDTLLGLYQGVPLTERGWSYGNVLPDRIVIYQKTVEASAGTQNGIKELVAEVVMHEIGHYFGFDDEELEELEGR